MRRDPVWTQAVDAGSLEVEGVDRSGCHAGRVRGLIHGSAGNGPVRVRTAAVVRQSVHLAGQVEGRGAAIIVQLPKNVIVASILLRQEDDVVNRSRWRSRRIQGQPNTGVGTEGNRASGSSAAASSPLPSRKNHRRIRRNGERNTGP